MQFHDQSLIMCSIQAHIMSLALYVLSMFICVYAQNPAKVCMFFGIDTLRKEKGILASEKYLEYGQIYLIVLIIRCSQIKQKINQLVIIFFLI